ncbi:MAG: Anti-sigma-E factor ChrR [Pseudomonadales bacterium]|nr:Anti-sigma-E factor ChrR [Pseudomonadales bacterium]
MSMATMTRYHPDQFLLNDYVAGSLPGAVALAIAVHLDYCPQCRAEVGQLSRLGGELFGGLDPVPVAEDAFARLLQRLDDIPPAAAAGAVPARGHGASQGLPRALRTLVPAGVDQLDWQRSGRGVRTSRLRFGDPRREVALYQIRAGAHAIEHGHGGNEITVVLNGAFSDHEGCYRAGDFVLRGSADVHRPVAAPDADCLCLGVLEAPVRLGGLIGRIANPFLRLHPR